MQVTADARNGDEERAVTPLTTLPPGTQLLVDGDTLVRVPDELAARFAPGDRLLAVSGSGELLHLPRAINLLVQNAVDRAHAAFHSLNLVEDAAITSFYARFAARLADDTVWAHITAANEEDVHDARARNRSTTRLAVSDRMRREMIAGLGEWQAMPSPRGAVTGTVEHKGWKVEQITDGLGVVGFVFEGRPNVFADATGVLRTGNTAVLRIGSDALGTARAIAAEALIPSLRDAGLSEDAIVLVDSAERAAGWALFSDRRLALAVARGSGPAVSTLGSIARQHGIPVSLHGTGGAWLIADQTADRDRFRATLFHSLDRKVCNTANVVLIPRSRASDLLPAALDALRARGEALGHGYRLHVVEDAATYVPDALFSSNTSLPDALFSSHTPISHTEGEPMRPVATPLARADLGHEWEWEHTPEVSLALVQDTNEAIALFNQYSPRFVASLISEDSAAHDRFFRAIDAPFVGDGFTRWVDGQYAVNRPEMGLSNWQFGRLFGRGGVLSGDGVFTVRLRAHQHDPDLHR